MGHYPFFSTVEYLLNRWPILKRGINIFPESIEEDILHELGDLITNVVIVGDGREFLSALIIPKAPVKRSDIENGIDKVNEKAVNQLARVKKFTLLDAETTFTQRGGELGPSMKIRRLFIAEKYKEIIDQMYNWWLDAQIDNKINDRGAKRLHWQLVLRKKSNQCFWSPLYMSTL